MDIIEMDIELSCLLVREIFLQCQADDREGEFVPWDFIIIEQSDIGTFLASGEIISDHIGEEHHVDLVDVRDAEYAK